MNKGWIKSHRELLGKPIWTEATPEQKVLLIMLLAMANHSEKQWECKGMPFIAQPGQLVTSLATLNERCGENSSVQKIRTALKRFARYGLLTDEPTSRNRLITIVNWGVYQGLDEAATGPSTDDQQATNKNVKNDKTLKKSNRRKQVYDESSIFYQLANSFLENIKMNHQEIIQQF